MARSCCAVVAYPVYRWPIVGRELRLEVQAVAMGEEILQIEVVMSIAEVVGTTIVVGSPLVPVFEGVGILLVAVGCIAQF